ncbi:hypothetical protein P153DRAFT_363778 [Dothidotthia symphoricarpi CBS 119687]|uniref:Subtilisin-like serine protease n=1 Tax=Dothidotthia symphoricarpi CBS 119687 TaxID=1392245 RepID=A0A6A6ARK0_9PLEO|nr:uncharacterized protein P153DRAFT_363778 [Dothidotthia symphoricarpi CBS 119687]KAF2133615.1 hypothetical protein P153DRAFT_363778 [Dothidotthia symphoricarpi CBS 119687]
MAVLPFPPTPFLESSALFTQRLVPVASSGQTVPKQGSTSPHDSISDKPINHIPDAPGVIHSQETVRDFLTSELGTPLLDELYNHLWLVARRQGNSIDPLNRQRVKAREIIATEDARLHLVWHHNRIYIKPMPLCLLNHDFWATYLPSPTDETLSSQEVIASQKESSTSAFDRKIALGFMRSYALLVRHRVDFFLARDSHLLPAELEWAKWSEFIRHFRLIKDEDVAKRYHYGQLRLSRLNWAVRLFRPSRETTTTAWFYEIPHWSTGGYVQQVTTPLLFGFASLSLVLSSMQVLLSVPAEDLSLHSLNAASLVPMKQALWLFSIIVLLLSGIIWLLLLVLPLMGLTWQLTWGYKNRANSNVKDVVYLKKEAVSNV